MNQRLPNSPAIQGVEYWIVRVPLLSEWASSPEFGHQIENDNRVILRLVDDEGYEGWGEFILEFPLETLDAMLPHLIGNSLSSIRPSFLDFVPDTNLYWRSPQAPSKFAPDVANLRGFLLSPLQTLIEMALADLLAHRAGVPLYQLWGGAWRERVAVDYWMGRVTPEHAKRCVERAKQLGFRGVKLKTTLEDPNVERLEAIKDAGGEHFTVTVDPNGRFHRLETALPTIRQMDRVGNMRVLEDPFPVSHLDDFARLRTDLEASLAIHVLRNTLLWPILKSGAAGCLNIGPAPGLFQGRMTGAIAEQANLAVWLGSDLGLGVATASQLHLAASIPNCQLPGDQVGPWLRESHLLCNDFALRDGFVSVPQSPGLGVEVDRGLLDRFTQSTRAWQT